MTTRNTFATLIALCLVLMFAECSRAQPAPAASAPAMTCGGEAGTARRVGIDAPVTLTAEETVDPPIHIRDGYWARCPTVKRPPDCAARSVGNWGTGRRCVPMTDPPGQPRVLKAGSIGDKRFVIDRNWRGRQTWQCMPASASAPPRWRPVDGYCR